MAGVRFARVDFRRELELLLAQVPVGRVTRCGDLANALGDNHASLAVFRFLREHPDVPGGHRVVTQRGHAAVPDAFRKLRAEGLRDEFPPFAAFQEHRPLAALQKEQILIAANVSRRNGFCTIRTIGAVDVAYAGERGFASLVVVDANGALKEEVLASQTVEFPYVPTYLAYREFPLIETAFRRLSECPSVLLVDGHGRLHPRRCGIACTVGVKLGVPTIGVAKSPLVETPHPRPTIGQAVAIRNGRELLGYALRTGGSVRPLYVSTGHRVAPTTAVRIVRGLCVTRIPEPLRIADAHASEWKEQRKKLRKRIELAPSPKEGNDRAE